MSLLDKIQIRQFKRPETDPPRLIPVYAPQKAAVTYRKALKPDLTIKNFKTFLEVLEDRGRWFFTTDYIFHAFETTVDEINAMMPVFVQEGLIRRLYGTEMFWNEHSQNNLLYAREDLIGMFRPASFSYVSFASALRQYGSFFRDEPYSLTVATSGNDGVFETDIGTLAFIHVDIGNFTFMGEGTFWNNESLCYYARPHLALFDLVKYQHDYLDDFERECLHKYMIDNPYLPQIRQERREAEEIEQRFAEMVQAAKQEMESTYAPC